MNTLHHTLYAWITIVSLSFSPQVTQAQNFVIRTMIQTLTHRCENRINIWDISSFYSQILARCIPFWINLSEYSFNHESLWEYLRDYWDILAPQNSPLYQQFILDLRAIRQRGIQYYLWRQRNENSTTDLAYRLREYSINDTNIRIFYWLLEQYVNI